MTHPQPPAALASHDPESECFATGPITPKPWPHTRRNRGLTWPGMLASHEPEYPVHGKRHNYIAYELEALGKTLRADLERRRKDDRRRLRLNHGDELRMVEFALQQHL